MELLNNFKEEWSPESLEKCIKGYVEANSIKIGDFAKPARAALTGSNASPGLFEVIWAAGKDECIGRCQDSIDGLNTVKEPQAAATAAGTGTAAAEAPAGVAESKPAAASVKLSGNLDKDIEQVGNEIRQLKEKLKAGGMSGKQIDKTDEVKALVAKLTEL